VEGKLIIDLNTNRSKLLLSISIGILLGLAYPPVPAGFLAVFCFVPFFVLLEKIDNNRDAFKYSYITFLFFCIVTSYWVSAFNVAKHWYLLLTGIGLIIIMPLFFYLVVLCWFFFRRHFGKFSLFTFPFIWVSLEFLLTQTEFSFPWLALGHTQTYDLTAIQFASYTGVFGLSFWLLWINVLIYFLYSKLKSAEWKWMSIKTIGSVIIIACVYFLPKLYGSAVLKNQNHDWLASANTVRVGVVQPDIDPYKKWEGNVEQQLSTLKTLTDKLKGKDVDLVVWPETSIPTYLLLLDNYVYLNRIRNQVDSLNINLLAGITDWICYKDGERAPKSSKWMKGGRRYDIYNTGVLFEPHSESVQKYAKVLLVPFAERIPWAEELSILNLDVIRWNFGASGYGIGKDTTVFKCQTRNSGETKFSILICYESVFPEFVSNFVRKGAQFLVVITNDSWWGNTSGVYQHKQFDILRAVENRRWVVRCANGGISCFIDPYGKIHEATKFGTEAAIVGNIQTISNLTFYSQHGDWLARICLMFSLGLLILAGVNKMLIKKH
jgi:apolipoprotein N-acyltransferase